MADGRYIGLNRPTRSPEVVLGTRPFRRTEENLVPVGHDLLTSESFAAASPHDQNIMLSILATIGQQHHINRKLRRWLTIAIIVAILEWLPIGFIISFTGPSYILFILRSVLP